ncbi:MAG TPA: UDP-2,3-diacylglucosamine diphosphatase [Piscirickettsiaceae bacterium]|nr:UDP-2,3-diacylglucosamine diphosphatase [Piscirickettsiaceae bacterium]
MPSPRSPLAPAPAIRMCPLKTSSLNPPKSSTARMTKTQIPPSGEGVPSFSFKPDFSARQSPNNSTQKLPFSLVIGDVHLQTEQTHPINQAFLRFLATQARQAHTLYIIGDLFERWLGDDIGLTEYAFAIDALRALTDSGVAVKLLYGNRDFLMREAFWDATGIQPLPEVKHTTIHGHRVMLCHGDELCTLDTAYQHARRKLRNRFVQWLFLKMPKAHRQAIGARLRTRSQAETANKDPALMDVDEQTVLAWFNAWPDTPHLIHGHTHKPGHHRYGNHHHRWVVGDWSAQGAILLVIDETQLKLEPAQVD